MKILESLICGIVQGLAEFLPISSSGHLALTHSFFGMGENDLAFDLLLHLATLLVVFCFYRRELFRLVPAGFSLVYHLITGAFPLKKEEKYVLCLLFGTLPLVLGFFVKDAVAGIMERPRLVGLMLILNGCILIMADVAAKRQKKRELSYLSAFAIGLFQLLALIPGLSRSGMTIAGGLFLGLSGEDAVRFSFLLSIPAILGGNLLELPSLVMAPIGASDLGVSLIGMAAAVLAGFLAMKALEHLGKRGKMSPFAYYCIIMGTLAASFA